MKTTDQYLSGKKLLLLGGNSNMVNVAKLAQRLGCEVHVMDYYDTSRSPAKLVADKRSDLSFFETDAVVDYIRANGIDGVLTGYTDSYLYQYLKICQAAGLPYYGGETAFGVATDKMLFKQACIRSGVGIIPGTNAYTLAEARAFAGKNGYPLMLKPTDNSGSRGVIKCEKEEDLEKCYEYALSFSPSKNVIVERFMDCRSVVCSYQLRGEEARLSALCDRLIYKSEENGSAFTLETKYPSDLLDRFIAEEDESIRRLFREHGFREGMVGIMGFVDEKGFYWCEMTYRPSGGHHYTFIENQNGIDGLALLIEFAVTGKTDSYCPEKENPYFRDYCGMIHIPGIPGALIAETAGAEKVRALPGVVEVCEHLRAGQTVGAEGTTAQEVLSIWFVAKDREAYEALIEQAELLYEIRDSQGNSLIKPRWKEDNRGTV